ncbi:MAG: FAD-dependent oxidoreductase [Syntrophomonadaceae bacterium]|jgi:NAD(P)H-nitrite reductase large subunit
MKTVAIKDNVYWVGGQDPNLKIFDIVIPTEHGTSSNAYLVKGTEKTALIYTVKSGSFAEYPKDLPKPVDINQIDEFRHHTDDHFVVVGGGIAALSAAEAIRCRNNTARITMVSDEAALPYYRPALSDYLGEELAEEKFYVKRPSWYDEQRIEVIIATSVKAINSSKRELFLSNGEKMAYNRLILATGARSNIPDIPGVDCEGVYALRSYKDVQTIKAVLEQVGQVVIIGGGVLGLEAAWEMSRLGKQVAIIEHNSRLMPRQLDADASQRLETLVRQHGVQLHLARDVRCLQGSPRVSSVKLTDGQVLNADLVLLSTGVKPNLELAQAAGIETDRGIVVDAGMRTSASDIYAAGDVAQFAGNLIGLWPTAMEMGRIAGANAAGDWQEYHPPTLSTLLVAFDMEVFSRGEVNPSQEETRVVEVWDPVENYYKKSFIKDGILIGEIVIASRVAAGASVTGLGRNAAGNRKVVGWGCRVCGCQHERPEPPEVCPACGAGRDVIDPIYTK